MLKLFTNYFVRMFTSMCWVEIDCPRSEGDQKIFDLLWVGELLSLHGLSFSYDVNQ